jgi:hypothetical protein
MRTIRETLESVDKALTHQHNLNNSERKNILELRAILGEIYMRPFTPLHERIPYNVYLDRLIYLLHFDTNRVQTTIAKMTQEFKSKSKANEEFIRKACIEVLLNYLKKI